MLDIELFRKNAEVIKFSQKHRGMPEELVDEVCRLDEKWREYLQQAEKLKHERNIVSEKINQLKKIGKKADAEIKRTKELVETLKKVDEEANTAKMMRDKPIIIVVNTEPEGKYTLKLARLERVSRFLTTISIVGTNVCGKSVTETYKGVCSIKSV